MRRLMLVFGVGFLFWGCVSTPKVVETDPNKRYGAEIEASDIHAVAEKMVGSLATFPGIQSYFEGGKRPVIFVDRLQNRTMEHLDLVAVTDTIRKGLLHSGKFRFVDMTVVDQLREQLDYQNEEGMVDPNSAKQFGKQIGADFMLYGSLVSMEKEDGRSKSIYYKFTINLLHIESGLLEWTDEKEFNRTEIRRIFGK